MSATVFRRGRRLLAAAAAVFAVVYPTLMPAATAAEQPFLRGNLTDARTAQAYDAIFSRGEGLWRTNKLVEARSAVEAAEKIRPDVPWSEAMLGRIEDALGNERAAALHYEKALALDAKLTKWSRAEFNKLPEAVGTALFVADTSHGYDTSETRAYVAEYAASHGDESRVLSLLRSDKYLDIYLEQRLDDLEKKGDSGSLARVARDSEVMLKLCARLRDQNALEYDLQFRLGKLYVKEGLYSDAVAPMRRVVDETHGIELPYALYLYAIALYRTGEYAAAENVADRAADLEPYYGDYDYIAGAAAFKAGDYAAQIAHQERARRLDSGLDDLMVTNDLGIAYAVLGNFEKANAELGGPGASSNDAIWGWRLTTEYASDGWDGVTSVWEEKHGSPFADSDLNEMMWRVIAGFLDLGDRAELDGAHYVALGHYVRAYTAAIDGYRRRGFGDGISDELADIHERMAQAYRALPLKPELPATATEAANRAERTVDDGNLLGALNLYLTAVEAAPWSPQLHYDFALTLAASGPPYLPWAVTEMRQAADLEPTEIIATDARKRIETWQQRIDELLAMCGGEIGRFASVDYPDVPQLFTRTGC